MALLTSLKTAQSFKSVREHGTSAVAKGLVLQTCPHPDSQTKQIGYIVSKKVGNAVTRNRVKRRLRALCNHIIGTYGINACDYVVVARPAALTREFISLEKDLKFTLHQTNTFAPLPTNVVEQNNPI